MTESPVRIELVDINTILKTLPHRYPMLLIDRVINIRADYSGIGIKNVTFNEMPFLGHFPERPSTGAACVTRSSAKAPKSTTRSRSVTM